jgi:hypothetical protein
MPVITFLQDMVSAVKGPYHRLVGRHTQRFCSRAVKRSANEQQKRVLFIAAAGADDFIARLLDLQDKRHTRTFAKHALEKKVTKKQVGLVLRAYISAILVLLGNSKGLLLQETGLNETEWIDLWCWVFDYQPEDIRLFNEVLTTYQQQGFDGLATSTGNVILNALSSGGNERCCLNIKLLQSTLLHDISAILRVKNEG